MLPHERVFFFLRVLISISSDFIDTFSDSKAKALSWRFLNAIFMFALGKLDPFENDVRIIQILC